MVDDARNLPQKELRRRRLTVEASRDYNLWQVARLPVLGPLSLGPIPDSKSSSDGNRIDRARERRSALPVVCVCVCVCVCVL